jgi:drug/metabolite transporter (DMT)-like permease
VTALAAAIMWGIHYPLVGSALKKISPLSVLLLTSIPAFVLLPFFMRTLRSDYGVLKAMEWGPRLTILALAVTSLLGTLLLYFSIDKKNATLASLIEISYPVFVALFSYVLFRQMHVNASVMLGALLVFAGVALIILNNP